MYRNGILKDLASNHISRLVLRKYNQFLKSLQFYIRKMILVRFHIIRKIKVHKNYLADIVPLPMDKVCVYCLLK